MLEQASMETLQAAALVVGDLAPVHLQNVPAAGAALSSDVVR